MYITYIKRDGFNVLTGKKRYRVYTCCEVKHNYRRVFKIIDLWGLPTAKYHQPNSFINPKHALFGK